jgi:hypothetical protein
MHSNTPMWVTILTSAALWLSKHGRRCRGSIARCVGSGAYLRSEDFYLRRTNCTYHHVMKLTFICFFLIIPILALSASGERLSEPEKIQYLINSIENLKTAVFIRNGDEGSAQAAADHLRLKLRMAGSRVKTANDFIRLCGSRSSFTGKPYLIRLVDGTVIDSKSFLENKLSELIAADAEPHKSIPDPPPPAPIATHVIAPP